MKQAVWWGKNPSQSQVGLDDALTEGVEQALSSQQQASAVVVAAAIAWVMVVAPRRTAVAPHTAR